MGGGFGQSLGGVLFFFWGGGRSLERPEKKLGEQKWMKLEVEEKKDGRKT